MRVGVGYIEDAAPEKKGRRYTVWVGLNLWLDCGDWSLGNATGFYFCFAADGAELAILSFGGGYFGAGDWGYYRDF